MSMRWAKRVGIKGGGLRCGVLNFGVLVVLVMALLALFIAYSVVAFVRGKARNLLNVERGSTTGGVGGGEENISQCVFSTLFSFILCCKHPGSHIQHANAP